MKTKETAARLFVLFVLAVLTASCQDKIQKADLVITNAIIWTGNENEPRAEAMAISGDTILSIGSSQKISEFIGKNTEIRDLSGKFVTPGFIDSHVHLLTGGFNLNSVQLRNAKTPAEFIQKIESFAKTVPKGSWILGGDWDHENWSGELPTKEWIDGVTKDNPVFITRLDGHMSLANSIALELAGVTNQTPDIDGGDIVRNTNGELTGLLKDNATDLIWRFVTEPTEEEKEQALMAAMKYLSSNGVTSVHHMSAAWHYLVLKKARANDKLITRIYAMYPLSDWGNLKKEIDINGSGDNWLKIGGLKGFVDGSLGSHTAAFFDPYLDKSSDNGLFVTPIDSIYKFVKAADKEDFQVMIHAIGDKAIHNLLNTFEKIQKENGNKDRRFRVEHAQHISQNDIKRFSQLNVIPSMQPYHAIDDGRWAEKLIGSDRIKTTYAFKSLLDEQAKLVFGSDWFVAPPIPLMGIYAAVTRRTLDDKNPEGWVPEQKITAVQALIAYTKNAAYASFEEDIKGTLESGKLADFVIISEDLTKVDPVRIKDLKILETYVGGKKVYDIQDH
ncbi:amidohydrolase [Maribacter sp. ACAM166]|uniref:amidohydrolase n=1 Tax=Maribacter sp. ACAM166 TaxID=2508996 RepID=UPI0010FDDE65|nr:amidohydrolase [Maribacter sp. ACAM166]TLP80478.1 amidohydrolase [Maribacter sp. ACAM166]